MRFLRSCNYHYEYPYSRLLFPFPFTRSLLPTSLSKIVKSIGLLL